MNIKILFAIIIVAGTSGFGCSTNKTANKTLVRAEVNTETVRTVTVENQSSYHLTVGEVGIKPGSTQTVDITEKHQYTAGNNYFEKSPVKIHATEWRVAGDLLEPKQIGDVIKRPDDSDKIVIKNKDF